jgi:predicted Zn finger-like uncharacterized protein
MSLVIQCPNCKAKMSVGEGRVGEQVRCPGCRQQFTAESKAGSGGRSKPSKAVRRRSGGKGSQTGLAVLLGVLIGGTFIIFCTIVWLANRKTNPDPPRSDPSADRGRPMFDPKDTPRTPTGGKDGKNEPVSPDPVVLDAVFTDLLRHARRQEDEEPLKTERALQALTADDRQRAEFMMKEVNESPSEFMPEHGPRLIKLGVTEWVTMISSKYAREDADFRAAVAAFSVAGMNSTELVKVMERWCLVPEGDRKTLAVAAKEDWPVARLTKEVRAAVVTLGAHRWLER